ncbi:ribonuclease T [Neiella marina]|uniref:Ribonuclease T n=1 Tax=Neiella holothuriorum TaxID=2870530 RepID=A0ABS7EJ73_9GAMM|nr:ribonuclease T [Neiella holothuriorum]MBW8192399.1 ribonuclease T [Neiella holothuriorum]
MTQLEDPKSTLASRFRGYYPVIVDIETAGFNAQTDAMLEIAATAISIDEHGQVYPIETFAYNVAPFEGSNLEASSLAFTGIDPFCPDRQAIDEKSMLNQLSKALRPLQKAHGCQRCVLVAHNAAFDNSFLNAAINRHNFKRSPFHPFVTFDTTTLSGLALGQTVLADACAAVEIEFDPKSAHSAAYDAQKTAELFCAIVNRYQQLGGWPLAPSEAALEESKFEAKK